MAFANAGFAFTKGTVQTSAPVVLHGPVSANRLRRHSRIGVRILKLLSSHRNDFGFDIDLLDIAVVRFFKLVPVGWPRPLGTDEAQESLTSLSIARDAIIG